MEKWHRAVTGVADVNHKYYDFNTSFQENQKQGQIRGLEVHLKLWLGGVLLVN